MIQELIKALPGVPVYHHQMVVTELPSAKGKYGLITIKEYDTSKAFKESYYKQVSLIIHKAEIQNE